MKRSHGFLPSNYYDTFEILFKFENWLRIFVYVILKLNYGSAWINTKINEKDTISTIFKRRLYEMRTMGHIGRVTNNPMLHLTLDDLMHIISNDTNKKFFNPYLPASIERVYKPKLLEIIQIRNNLVHFREVNRSESNRLSILMEDFLKPIKILLLELVQIFNSLQQFDYDFNVKELLPTKMDDWQSNYLNLQLKSKQFTSVNLYKHKDWIYFILRIEPLEDEIELYRIDPLKIISVINNIIPHLIFFSRFEIQFHDDNRDPSDWLQGMIFCISDKVFKNVQEELFSIFSSLVDEIEREFQKLHIFFEKNTSFKSDELRRKEISSSAFFTFTKEREIQAWTDDLIDHIDEKEGKSEYNGKEVDFPIPNIIENWSSISKNSKISRLEDMGFPWINIIHC